MRSSTKKSLKSLPQVLKSAVNEIDTGPSSCRDLQVKHNMLAITWNLVIIFRMHPGIPTGKFAEGMWISRLPFMLCRDLRAEYKVLKQKWATYQKKEAKLYSNMFRPSKVEPK
jgi:hypothetical protein